MKSHLLVVACAVVASVFVAPAGASVVYKYTGNNFDTFEGIGYDESMSITGTIGLATVLEPNTRSFIGTLGEPNEINPIGFTFSDGINTIAELDPSSLYLRVETDSASNIILWTGLAARGDIGVVMVTQDDITSTGDPAQTDLSETATGRGLVTSNPGTWSLVPIPPALYLFGTGLLGLVGMAKRKKVALQLQRMKAEFMEESS